MAELRSNQFCEILTIASTRFFGLLKALEGLTTSDVEAMEEKLFVKRKPDLLFILITSFSVGVLLTVLAPMAATITVAAPASELHAGVFIQDQVSFSFE